MNGTNSPTATAIADLLTQVITGMNDMLPADEQLPAGPDVVLMGEGGVLDSLGIANFLVALEEAMEERFGRALSLSDNDLTDLFAGPPVTPTTLAKHLADRMAG
jgi:hypothetical protein